MVNEHIVLPASDDTENDEISLPLGADRDDLALKTDAELLDLSREGNRAAYAVLWARHSAAGVASARYFIRELDPNDVVAEAYAKIFIALSQGKGPETAFRKYLQVTIRNIANSWRNEQRSLVDLNEVPEDSGFTQIDDDSDNRADRSLMKEAFSSLPTAWQEILWCTEVLGLKPQVIAARLNMKPNGVSALAFRAREGLRQSWIRAHLSDKDLPAECAENIDRLPGYALKNLSPRNHAKVEAHLAVCQRCPRVLAEAELTASRLHSTIVPLVLAGGGITGLSTLLSAHGTAASAAQIANPVTTGVVKVVSTKAVLLAGAGLVTVGAIVSAVVIPWGNNDITQPAQGLPPASSQPSASPDVDQPVAPFMDPGDDDGREDWTDRPEDAVRAALVSIPQIAAADAPEYSFDESTTFASAAPLLTGYATPSSTVTLFVSGNSIPHQQISVVTAASGGWSASVDMVPDGSYTVRAYQDVDGHPRSEASTRDFLVRNAEFLAPPIVNSVDTSESRYLPIVSGTGIPGATVSVLINGIANNSGIDADGTWSVTANRGGVIGANSLVVRQTEIAALTVSAPSEATSFDLVAPSVAADRSNGNLVVVVNAIPDSSLVITDGSTFAHNLTAPTGIERIRLFQNSGSASSPGSWPVTALYTGENGTRVGAPLVTDLG